jgi:hypothetical protein
LFYSVTCLRQYENASVVHFNIDREDSDEMPGDFRERKHTWFELSINDFLQELSGCLRYLHSFLC